MPDAKWIGCVLVTTLMTTVDAPRIAHASGSTIHVRIALHQRARRDPGATYVDISVQGTGAPIRLVRRVAGTCTATVIPDNEDVLARIICTEPAALGFEIGRANGEIVVRKGSVTPDAAPDAEISSPVIISRAALPGGATVVVDVPTS